MKFQKIDKAYIIIFFLIFVLGFALRVFDLENQIIFAYDQARDAFRVQDIIKKHDLKIVGPETSIPGIFHGPLFYYLIAIPFAFSQGHLFLPTLLMSLINLAGIPIIYFLSTSMFRSRKTGLLAALLFAISYEMTSYARYLSNVSPLPVLTLIFFLGLWLWINNKSPGLPLSVIGFALATQFNFFYVYLLFFYPLIYHLWRPKITRVSLTYSLLTSGFLLSSFFLSEIKFKFIATSSFFNFLLNQGRQEMSLMTFIDLYTRRLLESLKYNLFYWNSIYAFLLLVVVLLYFQPRRQKRAVEGKTFSFLCLWIFSSLPLFALPSRTHNATQINAALPGALFILFAHFLIVIFKKRQQILSVLILLSFISGNIFLFLHRDSKTTNLFAFEKGLVLNNQLKILDYIYEKAGQKSFSICAVTAPLFIDTTWSYLFEFYGAKKYDYLPLWAGYRDQASLGHLSQDNLHPQTRFLIIEGSDVIPKDATKLTLLHEETISEIIERKSFEGITVEYRQLLSEEERKKRKDESQKENEADWLMFEKDSRYSCFF